MENSIKVSQLMSPAALAVFTAVDIFKINRNTLEKMENKDLKNQINMEQSDFEACT